jgi:signal transduction histidine kinase
LAETLTKRRVWLAYAVAAVSIGAATAIRFSLDAVLGEHLIFSVYYLAVTLAAWAGGLRPALATAVVSSLIANWLFSEPQGSLRINNAEEFFALVLFLSVSTVIGTLAEISLRALARARNAEQQKDDFLAILAHELRNPLAVIFYTNRVGHRTGTKSTQDRSDVIERQVWQLNQMIDDLLDISRVTRGKFRLEFKPIDAASVINGALEKANPQIQARDHELKVNRSSEALPILADPLRMEQVLTNLLVHAAKYTPKRGRITLDLGLDDGHAVFRVRDNGEGIPKEMLGRVFDVFTQVEQALDRSDAGLGVGLALARTLVELHGGMVSVASDGPGLGSEYVVRLPLMESKPVRSADAPKREVSSDSAQESPAGG